MQYTNPESNIKYVIDESKFGTSQLGTTKDGLQMSYDWLTGAYTGNDRILSAVKDEEVANEIKQKAEAQTDSEETISEQTA